MPTTLQQFSKEAALIKAAQNKNVPKVFENSCSYLQVLENCLSVLINIIRISGKSVKMQLNAQADYFEIKMTAQK